MDWSALAAFHGVARAPPVGRAARAAPAMLWPSHRPELPAQLPWIGVSTEAWGESRLLWGHTFNSTDLAAAYDLLHDYGLRFFDTSELYGHQGQRLAESSEQLLGALASRRPEPPLLSTKYTPVPWTNVLSGGGLRLGRASVLEALRNSLTRLGASSVRKPCTTPLVPPAPLHKGVKTSNDRTTHAQDTHKTHAPWS
jgi:aryl-alcohol dehydrogenase-like predicted oxidoreductase